MLLTSALPTIILQEVFKLTVSMNMQLVMSLIVIAAVLAATLVLHSLRGLRPFLLLFLVLVVAQWLVFTRLDTLPFFQDRLSNPSFNVYMLTEHVAQAAHHAGGDRHAVVNA